MAEELNLVKLRSLYEYKTYDYIIAKYREDLFALWGKNNLDAIICPGFGSPAVKLGKGCNLTESAIYTYVWNILNVPSGTMPVTLV
jgi:fatty acid amide hydrolase